MDGVKRTITTVYNHDWSQNEKTSDELFSKYVNDVWSGLGHWWPIFFYLKLYPMSVCIVFEANWVTSSPNKCTKQPILAITLPSEGIWPMRPECEFSDESPNKCTQQVWNGLFGYFSEYKPKRPFAAICTRGSKLDEHCPKWNHVRKHNKFGFNEYLDNSWLCGIYGQSGYCASLLWLNFVI